MKKKKWLKWGRFIIIIILVIVFFYYENNHIGLTKYQYKTNRLKENKSYKIIQISDFHNKTFVQNNGRLVSIVEKEEPDMIAITGDFIDFHNTKTDVAVNFAKQLVQIAPVYYVTGNHEYVVDGEVLYNFEDELRKAGVHIMYNESEVLAGEITVIGLDDLSLNDDTLSRIANKTFGNGLNLLLAHEPQYFQKYVNSKVDIALCGHAHGGQIRIPFTGIGLVAPNQGFFPKYTSGEYSNNGTSMFVSRGLGNSILPLRIFNCPEILEVEIISEN